MTSKILSYNDFLEFRRSSILSSPLKIAPIVYSYLKNDGSYSLEMTGNDGKMIETNTGTGNDLTDFLTKIGNCNKIDRYDSPELPTHDFCDSSTWSGNYGQYNSLFVYSVDAGKVLHPVTFLASMDKDVSFSGTEINVVMLQTIDGSAVPVLHDVSSNISGNASTLSFDVDDGSLFSSGDHISVNGEFSVVDSVSSNTITLETGKELSSAPSVDDVVTITNPTSFGTGQMYNPYGGQYTGWYNHTSTTYLDIWVWFDINVPKWRVTRFYYPSMDAIYSTAHNVDTINNTRKAFFNYLETGINVSFCSSLNERIEIYSSSGGTISSPNSVPGTMRILFRSYNEW